MQVETIEIVVEETNVQKDMEYSHFIFVIFQGFWGWNQKQRGDNVKGQDDCMVLDKKRHLKQGLIKELCQFEF